MLAMVVSHCMEGSYYHIPRGLVRKFLDKLYVEGIGRFQCQCLNQTSKGPHKVSQICWETEPVIKVSECLRLVHDLPCRLRNT